MGFDPVSYMIGKSSSSGSVSDKNAYVSETAPSNSVGNDGDYYFELCSGITQAFAKDLEHNANSVGGWEFKANTAIDIAGVRVYVRSAQTGKTITLGTASGTVLKTVTANLSANEWTEVLFDTPVTLTAGTNYIVTTAADTFSMKYQSNPVLTTNRLSFVCGRYGDFPGTTDAINAYSTDVLYVHKVPYKVKKEYYKSGGNWTEVT